MPTDLINKIKVFGTQYKCLVMEGRNVVQYENALEQNMIKCCTDESKVNGRAGESFYVEYPNGSHKDENFSIWEDKAPSSRQISLLLKQ